MPIAFVDIRFCAHATEDVDKVLEAVRNIWPSVKIEDISFIRSCLEGHYGNPIILFETRIKDKEIVPKLYLVLLQTLERAAGSFLKEIFDDVSDFSLGIVGQFDVNPGLLVGGGDEVSLLVVGEGCDSISGIINLLDLAEAGFVAILGDLPLRVALF